MAPSKTSTVGKKATLFLVYSFLSLFPFGQLLRIEFWIFGLPFPIHPIEFVLLLIAMVSFSSIPMITADKKFIFFVAYLLFTLLIAFHYFPAIEIIRGSMYIIRLICVYALFMAIRDMNKNEKEKVMRITYVALLLVTIIGLFQYLLLPDLRWLRALHWDDHLGRLTSSFLDPGYTGLLMIFSFFLSLYFFRTYFKKLYIVGIIVSVVALLLTYSRASYLAFIVGVFTFLHQYKKIKLIFIIVPIIFVGIFFLPRGEGEGVNLARTASIILRIENYKETFAVFVNKPLFGTGYNLLCSARKYTYDHTKFLSHSCSGSDSSFLYLLASSGILGVIICSSLCMEILKNVDKKSSFMNTVFMPCILTLIVHGLFVNSVFYLWILSLVGIFAAISTKEST